MLFVLQSFANQFPSLEILDLSNNLIAAVEEMVIFLLKESTDLHYILHNLFIWIYNFWNNIVFLSLFSLCCQVFLPL